MATIEDADLEAAVEAVQKNPAQAAAWALISIARSQRLMADQDAAARVIRWADFEQPRLEDEIGGLQQRAQTAVDMLVELRDGQAEAGHPIMVDRLGMVLTALGHEETAAVCTHEHQRNAGTQISPLMVCADCGVQVTPAWGPGKDADHGN